VRPVTFLSVIYIKKAHNLHSGKSASGQFLADYFPWESLAQVRDSLPEVVTVFLGGYFTLKFAC
jgi:hypothetical protein